MATLSTSVRSPPPYSQRCVKCDQPHATGECKIPICTPPKSLNCGRAQPDKFTDCRSQKQHSSCLHRRQPRITKPTTSALQFKQAHFTAFKPPASPLRLHTTWAQTASQPPTTTDLHCLSSLLRTIESSLSMSNIQNLCHTLRSSVLRLQTTSDRLSKITLGLHDFVACFWSPTNHDLRMVVWNDNSGTPKNSELISCPSTT